MLLAYLAANLTAGFSLSAVWTIDEASHSLGAVAWYFIGWTGIFAILVALAGLAAVPALAYAECARQRKFPFYLACGLFVALLPVLIFPPHDAVLFSRDGFLVCGFFGGGGLIAAAMYWLIAGRYAGRIEENQRAS
jgi:hypothetical protein